MSISPYDHCGMSDDALADERKAQEMVNRAKRILIDARSYTSIMEERRG